MQKLDNKLKQAAQMYEKQFLRQMVKAMRNTVSHSEMTKPGMAENIFREQLDEKYVDGWMKTGGTGFSEVIYKDLVNKFFPQLQKSPKKMARPKSITDRFKGLKAPAALEQKNKQSFNLMLSPAKGKSYLQLPWQGKFEKQFELESGEKVAMFSHPFGLKSTFVFQGQMNPGLLDKNLSAGENFALLSPETQSMTWQVEKTDSLKAP